MSNLDTIMLIDDNRADNFYHRLIIEEAGIANKVLTFQQADEALTALQESNGKIADLIFLDINMPRMNGFQFLDSYMNLDKKNKAKVTIIMLTTSLNPEDQERANSYSEVKGFLNKPLTQETLKEIAEIYLNKKNRQDINNPNGLTILR